MARKSTSGVPYLRFHSTKGLWYYTLPNGREVSLGRDRVAAIRDARAANVERERIESQRSANAALSALRGDDDIDVAEFLERWATHTVPHAVSQKSRAALAPASVKRYQKTVRLAARGSADYTPLTAPGDRPLRYVRTADVNRWLKQFPTVQANRHRSALSLAWQDAVREGLADTNVVRDADRQHEVLMRADGTKAALRDRLSLEQFRAIRDHADTPEWLRTAMDLSLGLGLRPGDVQRLRWDQLEDNGTVLRVTPSKTEKTSGMTIVYHLGERLREVFAAARDNVASPYVVHCIPKRKVRSADRDHWTQLSKEQISRTFSKQRAAAGVRPQKDRTPQTLYEVRSLAAALYEEQLGAQARVEVVERQSAALGGAQAALGHSGQQMTEHYLSRAGREVHVNADLHW